MDYLDLLDWRRWSSWSAYRAEPHPGRLILLTTRGETDYLDLSYKSDDRLLFGRESAGVPAEVHAAADHRAIIPLRPGVRSLNVALAAAMVAGEALRQTGPARNGR